MFLSQVGLSVAMPNKAYLNARRHLGTLRLLGRPLLGFAALGPTYTFIVFSALVSDVTHCPFHQLIEGGACCRRIGVVDHAYHAVALA